MQSFDPATITQKIVTVLLPEFTTLLGKATSLKDVQKHCLALCDRLATEAWQDHKILLKSTKEPQSEMEESKDEQNFVKTIMKEATQFIEALRRYELEQQEII